MPRRPAMTDPAAFTSDFLHTYLELGFGRMSKRDTELLVLRLLDEHSELGKLDDWEVARRLGLTPARVRTLRAEARYVYLDETQQREALHDGFFAALTPERLVRRTDGRLDITLSDTFVRDGVRARCEALGSPADFGFNHDRLNLTVGGFIELCRDLLTEDEQDLLRTALDTARLFPAHNLWERVRRAVTDEHDQVDPRRIIAIARTISGELKALEQVLQP